MSKETQAISITEYMEYMNLKAWFKSHKFENIELRKLIEDCTCNREIEGCSCYASFLIKRGQV